MDPTATLTEMLNLAAQFVDCPERKFLDDDNHDGCSCANNLERMGDLVWALHGWIQTGGFLPEQWRRQ